MPTAVDLSRVRRIWVRAPNWLGDYVMATAAFARIRAAFPGAHITVGLRPFLRSLVDPAHFDAVVETPKADGFGGLWQQVRTMRAGAYDLAIVLPNSLTTGLVPFLAGVPLRLGYTQSRPGLMNLGLRARVRRHFWQRRSGPARHPTPMPNYYRDLLDVLGLPGDALHPALSFTTADAAWVDAHLRERGLDETARLALLVVGANFGASKLWPPESFAALARRLQEQHGLRALVLVGPAEVELGERIAREGRALAMTQPVLPLEKLCALVARSQVMVTGDTGPRHLAVAFDRPVVCLMGPNDPNYTNYCMEHTLLIRKDLPCMPCQRKVCPLGHQRCMRDISVDEVERAVVQVLDRYPALPRYAAAAPAGSRLR